MKKQLIEAVKIALLPELGEIKEAVKINTIKIDDMSKRIDDLNKRIDDMNKRIDDLYNSMQLGFTNIQSQINQMRNDISKLGDRNYDSILERLAKLEAKAS